MNWTKTSAVELESGPYKIIAISAGDPAPRYRLSRDGKVLGWHDSIALAQADAERLHWPSRKWEE
jgi:hypothetical protein